MSRSVLLPRVSCAVAGALALVAVACGQAETSELEARTTTPEVAERPVEGTLEPVAADLATDAPAPLPTPDSVTTEREAREAEIERRERELAEHEAKLRERQLAAREAEIAAREARLARERQEPAPVAAPAPAPEPEPAPAQQAELPSLSAEPDAVALPPLEQPAPAPRTPVRLAVDTPLYLELLHTVSSGTAEVGDRLEAVVAEDVRAGGRVAIPAGTRVLGSVTGVESLRRIGGRGELQMRFEELTLPDGDRVAITAPVAMKGRGETKRDAATIGGAAAGGAVIGRNVGGGDKSKRTAIGAVLGAAVGTVIAARTQGEELELPVGTELTAVLAEEIEVLAEDRAADERWRESRRRRD